jgi:hypothetical protein
MRVPVMFEEPVVFQLANPVEHVRPELETGKCANAPVPPGVVPCPEQRAIYTVRMSQERQTSLNPNVPDNSIGRLVRTDLAIRSKCKAVPASAGDLFTYHNKQAIVPAFPSIGLGLKTVMIGKYYDIKVRSLASPDDLGHLSCTIGYGGMDMYRRAVIVAVPSLWH